MRCLDVTAPDPADCSRIVLRRHEAASDRVLSLKGVFAPDDRSI
jgi:hypothetical protein